MLIAANGGSVNFESLYIATLVLVFAVSLCVNHMTYLYMSISHLAGDGWYDDFG